MAASIVLSFPERELPTEEQIKNFRSCLIEWEDEDVTGRMKITIDQIEELVALEAQYMAHKAHSRIFFGGPVSLRYLAVREPVGFETRFPAEKAHHGANDTDKRIIASEHSPETATRTALFNALWEMLPDCIYGFEQMWPSFLTHARTEADVSGHATRNLLEPCWKMINQLIRTWWTRYDIARTQPEILLNEQRYASGEEEDSIGASPTVKMFVDHAYVIKLGENEQMAVYVEDKGPGLLNIKDLKHFINKGVGAILEERINVCQNMVYHLAQSLKYTVTGKCLYGVMLDDRSLIAMEWEYPGENFGATHQSTMLLRYWDMKSKGRVSFVSMLYLLIRALITYDVFLEEDMESDSGGSRSSDEMSVDSQ